MPAVCPRYIQTYLVLCGIRGSEWNGLIIIFLFSSPFFWLRTGRSCHIFNFRCKRPMVASRLSIPYHTGQYGRNILYRPAIRYAWPPYFIPEKIPAVPTSYRRNPTVLAGNWIPDRNMKYTFFFFFFYFIFAREKPHHTKVIDSVPYRLVRPEYIVPASILVRSTPLFRTGKNTGRIGIVPAKFGCTGRIYRLYWRNTFFFFFFLIFFSFF